MERGRLRGGFRRILGHLVEVNVLLFGVVLLKTAQSIRGDRRQPRSQNSCRAEASTGKRLAATVYI